MECVLGPRSCDVLLGHVMSCLGHVMSCWVMWCHVSYRYNLCLIYDDCCAICCL